MHKFSTFQNVLDEAVFKLPRGHKKLKSKKERIVGKVYDVVFTKKGKDTFVYVDGQELAQYKNEKEARKNAKELIKLLGEDLSDFIEEVLEEPKIEDTLGFSNGLKGNQTYNDVAEKIATIK